MLPELQTAMNTDSVFLKLSGTGRFPYGSNILAAYDRWYRLRLVLLQSWVEIRKGAVSNSLF